MKLEARPAIHVEKSLLTVWVGQHIWWTESQGISRIGQTVLARYIVSDMVPTCQLCGCVGGRVQKRGNGLCLPFCLKDSCPPAPALMPDTSVPPCMPLVPLNLLPWCWSSEGVSRSKSMCGFFKGNCSSNFFHQLNPCWFLQPEVMGTYLPGTGTLGWRARCGAGTPYT